MNSMNLSPLQKKRLMARSKLSVDSESNIIKTGEAINGDVIWYWINACRALHLDPNDVILENINKLMSRYPGGNFDAHYSENRKQGDL